MKVKLVKIERFWTILISRENGTSNDYRFSTKKEAMKWAKLAGIRLQ